MLQTVSQVGTFGQTGPDLCRRFRFSAVRELGLALTLRALSLSGRSRLRELRPGPTFDVGPKNS